MLNELLRRGKIKADELTGTAYQQFKNAVTRAVGVYESVEVDTFDFDILPGDRFLLCTDGLHAYLEEARLPALLADGELRDVPQALIDHANSGGGHDNITSVVVRIPDSADSAQPHRGHASLKLEALKAMHMFRYLSYRELVRVASIATVIERAAGAEIFVEGAQGDAMYIVMSGAVRLSKQGTEVADLVGGEHFGEMSLADQSVRSLSAHTLGDTRLIVVRRDDFYEIVKKEPQLATKLLWSFVQVLGARLRKTTNDLSAALRGERKPDEAELENLVQENLVQD